MKWVFFIIILALIIGFYLVIKRQNEYNEEELKRNKLLNGTLNFASSNINEIQNQKFSAIDVFINSNFVTTTSGIFGKIWGMIV